MGEWARHFERCCDCGRCDVPHRAKGLCGRCYERASNLRNRTNSADHRRGALRGTPLLRIPPAELRRQYCELRRSTLDIAADLGSSRHYVYCLLHRWEIAVRPQREARLLALEQGKISGHRRVHVDEYFFDRWSPSMAYVLGLVATDGCIHAPEIDPRTGRRKAAILAFAQRDRELLDKVCGLMQCDATVSFSPSRRCATTVAGPLHRVRITSARLLARLEELGIGPRKSRTLCFPPVPRELIRHFIRGCWDGDGSIFRGRGLLIASYVTGSRDFIDGLVGKLTDDGFSRRTVYVEQRKNPSFKISFQGSEAVRLCAYLYDGVPESERLSRKFQIYESLVRESRGAAVK